MAPEELAEWTDPGVAFEEIPREECLRLIASQLIGRIAVADFNAPPLVVPVNFVLDGEAVVFRTDYGSKFRLAVLREAPMSFQVDGLDPGQRTGWSVLLQGPATELPEGATHGLRLQPFAPGRKTHWVRIEPQSITGRRIRFSESRPWVDGRGYL
jgi:nitroimidazol reductase NimA-like FMN-containing flavoprotein (pyridoxamine 5'-phosphate oxidase superfamily)